MEIKIGVNLKNKIDEFNNALGRVINLQNLIIDRLDLSYIHFPIMTIQNITINQKNIFFSNCVFHGNADFFAQIFHGICRFENSHFKDSANFRGATFKKKVFFNKCIFEHNVRFIEAIFENKVSFWGAIFHDKVHFDSTVFKETFNFTKTQINKITLVNTNVENANLLEISAYDETNPKDPKPLTKDNFENKESARLIKAHFEKQNNITEANKYFVIEQEKYIDELKDKDNKTEGGKLTKLFPLYINKLVSNFGTDWVRSIIVLFLWGFVSLFSFMIFRYSCFTYPNEFYMANEWNKSNIVITVFIFIIFVLAYLLNLYFVEVQNYKRKAIIGYFRFLYKHIKIKSKLYKTLMIIKFCTLSLVAICIFIFCLYDSNLFNLISKLINPINAFKDDETFKGYEAFGAIIRIVSATIIYQIIVAFRQFTRRG